MTRGTNSKTIEKSVSKSKSKKIQKEKNSWSIFKLFGACKRNRKLPSQNTEECHSETEKCTSEIVPKQSDEGPQIDVEASRIEKLWRQGKLQEFINVLIAKIQDEPNQNLKQVQPFLFEIKKYLNPINYQKLEQKITGLSENKAPVENVSPQKQVVKNASPAVQQKETLLASIRKVAKDQNSFPSLQDDVSCKTLICPLCLNFLYKSQTTICGHNFCLKCIDEYLIVRKTCFICDKTIRNTKGTLLRPCFAIDDVIQQIVIKCEESDVKVAWERQKCEYNMWEIQRKVGKIQVGDKIDVRDTDYIWCVGHVKLVVESINREPIVAIHYEGWNMWYDELLPVSSPRLAKYGFYSSRNDIPKYRLQTGKGQMQALIVNRMANVQPTCLISKKCLQKNSKKGRASGSEQLQMTDDERRRQENSNMGDSLDERLEDFFNKYGDANYFSGNQQFSGISTAQSQPNSPESDENLNSHIERHNIQVLSQNSIQPVFLRNAIQTLGSVGQGGANIANQLLAPQLQQNVTFQRTQTVAPITQFQPERETGQRTHLVNLMRHIAGIREQAAQAQQQQR